MSYRAAGSLFFVFFGSCSGRLLIWVSGKAVKELKLSYHNGYIQ